jgi:hypothetical protein
MASRIHYRSAVDGKYVTKKYAEKHTATTVKETDKNIPKKSLKK